MSLRLIHTADWQLGKPFHNLPAEIAPLLREARFEAVRRIAELATTHEVAAVLVAGDVFDGHLVPEKTIIQALAAMRGFAGPWILLPGNHDAALAESVWTRLERVGRPDNVIVASTFAPIALADGRLVVLPAPLTERHTSDDLTAWMDWAESPSGAFRIGLAHGSVAGRLPETADSANPIDGERAARARLDYLALGDWHGTLQIAPRTWYAGTPEPDRFRSNDAGNALLIELDRPGAEPSVTKLPTRRHGWHQLALDLTAVDEPKLALERLLAPLAARERAVVQLTLQGILGLQARADLETELTRWTGELCHLEICDELLAAPSERDLDRLGATPLVGNVAADLALRAKAGDEVAALALRFLFIEHGRAGGAA